MRDKRTSIDKGRARLLPSRGPCTNHGSAGASPSPGGRARWPSLMRCLMRLQTLIAALAVLGAMSAPACATDDVKSAATTVPGKVGKLPFLTFDTRTKEIRVECETLGVEAPLEFFAVVVNGPEHEAVVRSKAKPSDLHTALLALGLKPGAPVSYSKALDKWLPPHGPPLHIHMEYLKDGKLVSEPANRWM